MPTVYIWRPHGEDNPYGHVALATDKYYVSFWTAQVLFDSDEEIQQEESKAKRLKRKLTDLLNAVGVFKGHRGGLVFHQDLDKEYETDQDPVEYQIDATLTNEDINSLYEDFLDYNGINPEDVTLARGEQLYKTRKEYEELPQEEARKVKEEPELPQKSMANTKYSFSVELVTCIKEDDDSVPFYHKQQSCVSFVFNLIQTTWLKHHPDRPIPVLFKTPGVLITSNVRSRNNECGKTGDYAYEVPWFEEQVVQNYLLTGDIDNKSAPTAPVIKLGVFTRPFSLFWTVVIVTFFLCCLFPVHVGFTLKIVMSYRYGTMLYTVVRKWDRQHFKDLLKHPLNFWIFYYFYTVFYAHFAMMFMKMYEYIYESE